MLFGPSRSEVWKQLANELGGSYESSFWRGTQLYAKVNGWTVHLDIRVVPVGKIMIPFTRARARLTTLDSFRFRLYRGTFLSELGKFLGMQDIATGDAAFDERFVLKATDEERACELFGSQTLRDTLLRQKASLDIQLNDRTSLAISLPKSVFELQCQTAGAVKDPERLKGIYDVFGETLEQLTAIGSAGPPPDEHDPLST